jgi:phosphopantothenoylcysteine decarboxylase/phosphopantothenate--cysteine ligase
MAEPEEILKAISGLLDTGEKDRLKDCKVIVTAGPTFEPIDPIRYIANRSSGRQGYALAKAAAARGAKTVLISGPTNLPAPPGVRVVAVETAEEMLKACERELPADIGIFAAAVADWRISNVSSEKIKKTGASGVPSLALTENPDILAGIARHKWRPRLLVGFAAETENVIENGKTKLKRKSADIIIANDVSAKSGVMGGDRNRVHVISGDQVESWDILSKEEVASRLMDKFAQRLQSARKAAE